MQSTPASTDLAHGVDGRAAATSLVLVRAGGQRFALPVAAAREIAPLRAATPLPGSAPWVRGLINLRGRIVTVIDLAGRLGLGAALDASPDAERRVILVEHGAAEERRLGGVEVEAVLAVVRAAGAQLHEAAAETVASLSLEPALVRALGRTDDGEPFVLLDAEALFRPAPASARTVPPMHPSEG